VQVGGRRTKPRVGHAALSYHWAILLRKRCCGLIQPDVWGLRGPSGADRVASSARECGVAAADRGTTNQRWEQHGYLRRVGCSLRRDSRQVIQIQTHNASPRTRFELPGSCGLARFLVPRRRDAAVEQAVLGRPGATPISGRLAAGFFHRAPLRRLPVLLMESLDSRDRGTRFLAFCDAVTPLQFGPAVSLFPRAFKGGAYNGETTTPLIKRLIGCGEYRRRSK